MEEFLLQYGYLALSVGTFLEGETAILVASSLVHSGIFGGPATVIFGFFGSFVSDWLYFSIGRLNGRLFVDRRPKLKSKLDPARNFFNRNRLTVLVSYRFLYGFRILLPLMIGMSDIRAVQFLGYSIATGILWATVVSIVGYLAGSIFHLTPTTFEDNFLLIIGGFVAFGIIIGFFIRRFAEKKIGAPPAK